MTTHTLDRHLDSIQRTARAVEEHARNVRFYTRDCDTLDSALKRGLSGFVVLFDSDESKPPEVHPIGRADAKVKIERGNSPEDWTVNYESSDPNGIARRIAAGKSVREEHETPPAVNTQGKKQLTRDALRAKQVADSAKAKADRQEGIARTQRFAAAVKAASDKQWNRSA